MSFVPASVLYHPDFGSTVFAEMAVHEWRRQAEDLDVTEVTVDDPR
ncbi:hypothetical protein ACERIT_03760 [Halopenitus sp. H-Gu1]